MRSRGKQNNTNQKGEEREMSPMTKSVLRRIGLGVGVVMSFYLFLGPFSKKALASNGCYDSSVTCTMNMGGGSGQGQEGVCGYGTFQDGADGCFCFLSGGEAMDNGNWMCSQLN